MVFVAAERCCVLLIVPSLATGLGRKEKTPGPHMAGRVPHYAHPSPAYNTRITTCFCFNTPKMSYPTRSLQSQHLRSTSTSLGGSQGQQHPMLLARIAEKKAELASLKDLQALSAGLADQMQMLAEKLSTLSDGTEGAVPPLYPASLGASSIIRYTDVLRVQRSRRCCRIGITC
jgi:hypothetical protein